MHDGIESLGNATVFTTQDSNSGYCQVLLRGREEDKTAIVCRTGSCRFKQMYLGLMNSVVTFKPAMDILFNHFKMRKCHMYLDVTINFYNNYYVHLRHSQMS